MTDLAELFKDGPPEKGSFLSRVFGIFSEEVIRIWARAEESPYSIHDKRPTLYEKCGSSKRATLDFLLQKDGGFFVSEMKCEIQYQNYKYWRLTDPEQLKHHYSSSNSFRMFLDLSRDTDSVRVLAAGEPIDVKGTVLVWGASTSEGECLVKSRFGIADILTVESCVNDLVAWDNQQYLNLLKAREHWLSSLFKGLREG